MQKNLYNKEKNAYFADEMTMKSTRITLWAIMLLSVLSLTTTVQAERGRASYYHNKLHGRKTASGERYHRDSLTCAHLRYRFGTWLRVTNTWDGKSVVVKVNDRGPYSKKYCIDLSLAAAKKIGIVGTGHAIVDIKIVNGPENVIIPYPLDDEDDDTLNIELDFVPAPKYPFPGL